MNQKDRREGRGNGELHHVQAIAAFDQTTLDHFRVDPDVALTVLHSRPENAVVLGQIALRERGHDAAATGAGDGELCLADFDGFADPGLLNEALRRFRCVD